jgi:DNA-binding response OmpR family regulator
VERVAISTTLTTTIEYRKVRKILIIDDDVDYAESLKSVLEARAHHVMWAPDSGAGMKVIASTPPDLIILDIMMSTMAEGLHLAYRLKSDPKYAHIPILMLTGITQRTGLKFDPDDDAEFIPVDDYMEKSSSLDVLCDHITRILKRSRTSSREE